MEKYHEIVNIIIFYYNQDEMANYDKKTGKK